MQEHDPKVKSSGMNDPVQVFMASRLSLRAKLISIISLIVLSALGGMIFFASDIFRRESELRIQESNLSLAQSAQEWFEAELRHIRYTGRNAGRALEERGTVERLFRENPDFIYLGLGSGGRFSPELYNRKLMQADGITTREIRNLHRANRAYIQNALQGQFVVFNASVGQRLVLGICQKIGKAALLIYMEPSRFQKVFESQKPVSIYMVNDRGAVVIHSDPKVVLARANFIKKEIIKKMWQSPVFSGQSRYTDKQNQKVYLASYKKLRIGSLGLVAQVEEDVAFEPVNRIRNRNLLLAGIFLSIAIVIVYFFARLMTVPILSLVRATNEVEKGNYNIEITPASRDEVGQLTHAFGRMTRGLSEREKIKDAFGRFVNKEIAEQVLVGGIKLGGEERTAAVFFSDLRNFTAMSENMSPEAVVAFLNDYFTRMVSCVDKTHGVVDKYIGDAIMAHWGAIKTKGNETANAINTALMMRKALLEFNRENKDKRPLLRTGCGINTGKVISGQIGSEDRLEYTVIGDAVNLASRIEALNKSFGTDILISDDSYARVDDIFNVKTMPAIRVKGKAQPQQIYAVLGRNDDPRCPRSLDELRRLVGIEFNASELKAGHMSMAKEEKFEISG